MQLLLNEEWRQHIACWLDLRVQRDGVERCRHVLVAISLRPRGRNGDQNEKLRAIEGAAGEASLEWTGWPVTEPLILLALRKPLWHKAFLTGWLVHSEERTPEHQRAQHATT